MWSAYCLGFYARLFKRVHRKFFISLFDLYIKVRKLLNARIKSVFETNTKKNFAELFFILQGRIRLTT